MIMWELESCMATLRKIIVNPRLSKLVMSERIIGTVCIS
jgi:hypothetical protein